MRLVPFQLSILFVCVGVLGPATASAGFILVDDFESYNPGAFAPQLVGTSWTSSGSPAAVAVGGSVPVASGDFFGAGNQILSLETGSGTLFNSDVTITDGSQGTVFFRMGKRGDLNGRGRVAVDDNAGGFNVAAGVFAATDNGPEMAGRDDASETVIFNMTGNSVYNIWLSLDNSTNTYKIYVQSDDDAAFASQTDVTPTAFAFNASEIAATGVIDRLALISVDGPGVYVDDIYVDNTSENLSNPLIPEPGALGLLGLGGLFLMARRRVD